MFTLYHELINEGQLKFLHKVRKKLQSHNPELTHSGGNQSPFQEIQSPFHTVQTVDWQFEQQCFRPVDNLEVVEDVSDI